MIVYSKSNEETLPGRSFNKVASVAEGFTTLTYTYDAEHQGIKQSDGSATIRYLNDLVAGASAEYHAGSGGVWHDYLTVEGQRIVIEKRPSRSKAVNKFNHFPESAPACFRIS